MAKKQRHTPEQLCRHYHRIDPAATAAYVAAYRELWDSDSEETDGQERLDQCERIVSVELPVILDPDDDVPF
jgi:hypothetical protein